MVDRVLDAVLSHYVSIGVAAVGGVVLALLRKYRPKDAAPALYGLGAFVLIVGFAAVLRVGVKLDRYIDRGGSRITADNVEGFVRTWADGFSFGVQRVDELRAETKFALRLTTKEGRSAIVYQPLDQPRYLIFQSAVKPGPVEEAQFAALSQPARDGFLEEVRLEVARAGHDFQMIPGTATFAARQRVPITENLTEHDFLSALDTVLIGQILARDALVIGLRRLQSR